MAGIPDVEGQKSVNRPKSRNRWECNSNGSIRSLYDVTYREGAAEAIKTEGEGEISGIARFVIGPGDSN